MLSDSVNLKLELLCHGVNFSDNFLHYYKNQDKLIEKRRPYGTGDNVILNSNTRTPQEIIIDNQVISAANYNPTSQIFIDIENGCPILRHNNNKTNITFPNRPLSYGKTLSNGELFEKYVTVYGDSTLGIFSPGHCYYFNNGRECKFCSLGAARDNLSDHKMRIKGELAGEAINLAISDEKKRYTRVLLNGGTIPNYDKGYSIHMDLLERVKNKNLNSSLEYYLISMPPKDFRLFERFSCLGQKMSMSLEIYNKKLFTEICPGKAQDYTRDLFFDAFEAAVEILGHGNVYVGFVAGMEPLASIIEGIEYFADMGVVPAVAVFHPDAGSNYSGHPRPSIKFLKSLGQKMSDIYKREGFKPLIEGSGRNSLDTEAYLGGFL